ncbi:MAG: anion permease, partial [Paludibacteraceae bacterium]|nr:anion permease [Paludibacteraceae bacterium]
MSKSKLIRLAACLIPAIVIWLLPLNMFGEHFAVTEQRMLAIFIMAALMWILEPVPAWVTSTFSILVMLFTVSTGG